MTATIVPITTSRIAQSRADAASILRPDRVEGAPSFAEVLAEQTEPEAQASTDSSPDDAASARDDPAESQEQDPAGRDEQETSEVLRDKASEPSERVAGGEKSASVPVVQAPDAVDSQERDSAVTGEQETAEVLRAKPPEPSEKVAVGEKSAGVPVVQAPDAQAATIRGVKRELTHAATVDLAQLALDELIAEPVTASAKIPGKFPGGPGPALTSAPSHPNLFTSEGPPAPAPQTRPEPVGVGPPRPNPHAGHRTEPSRSIGLETAMPMSAEPARAEAARTQASSRSEAQPGSNLVGRTELLTRLTGSVEAARGAIVGVDRAGYQTIDRDLRSGRTAPTTQAPALRASREQVLASVQRGLASVLTQGGGRMTVVLRPEQLGEVRVRMEAKDGVVSARLSATTEAARQTLESGLDLLRASMESRGIRVESLTIDATEPQPGAHTRSDADAGGGRQHAERESGAQTPQNSRARIPDNEAETPSVQGIWTEYGIDAVA
jgi:flagellar hook-length control protein FliK